MNRDAVPGVERETAFPVVLRATDGQAAAEICCSGGQSLLQDTELTFPEGEGCNPQKAWRGIIQASRQTCACCMTSVALKDSIPPSFKICSEISLCLLKS